RTKCERKVPPVHSVSTPEQWELVVGRTWSGSPKVVLRSLWRPLPHEKKRLERWQKKKIFGGSFRGYKDWTDEHLRLLADEWEFCTAENWGGTTGLGSTYGSAGGLGGKTGVTASGMEADAVTPHDYTGENTVSDVEGHHVNSKVKDR
ncbi:unnamed protein product, partial [Choristocarpus tenellus]